MYGSNPQSPDAYWIGAAAAAAATLYCLYRALSSVRRDRLVADTPLVRIRSAAQGYVKVSGHAAAGPDGVLAAPLSSRPCIWWRYHIEHKVRNAKGETRWEPVDSAASVSLFALRDADSTCLVGPVRAEITPTSKNVWYGEESRPVSFCGTSLGFSTEGKYRYTECLLTEGDHLSVLGEFHAHSETGDSSAAAAGLLKAWKADQAGLLARFDRNHDGHIDAQEWEAARQEAQHEAQAQSLTAPVTRMCVISEPTNGEPFLIAALDEQHLVRREQLHAVLFFSLGLLGVGACAWAIERARDAQQALSHVTDPRTASSLLPLLAFVPAVIALARWAVRRQQD